MQSLQIYFILILHSALLIYGCSCIPVHWKLKKQNETKETVEQIPQITQIPQIPPTIPDFASSRVLMKESRYPIFSASSQSTTPNSNPIQSYDAFQSNPNSRPKLQRANTDNQNTNSETTSSSTSTYQSQQCHQRPGMQRAKTTDPRPAYILENKKSLQILMRDSRYPIFSSMPPSTAYNTQTQRPNASQVEKTAMNEIRENELIRPLKQRKEHNQPINKSILRQNKDGTAKHVDRQSNTRDDLETTEKPKMQRNLSENKRHNEKEIMYTHQDFATNGSLSDKEYEDFIEQFYDLYT